MLNLIKAKEGKHGVKCKDEEVPKGSPQDVTISQCLRRWCNMKIGDV
jgi:hypothetical protein